MTLGIGGVADSMKMSEEEDDLLAGASMGGEGLDPEEPMGLEEPGEEGLEGDLEGESQYSESEVRDALMDSGVEEAVIDAVMDSLASGGVGEEAPELGPEEAEIGEPTGVGEEPMMDNQMGGMYESRNRRGRMMCEDVTADVNTIASLITDDPDVFTK